MDIEQFDQAAKEFRMYADMLLMRANDDIRQARESLTSAEPRGPSNEAIAALILSRLAATIEELMRCSDKMSTCIGATARYRMFLAYLDLPPLAQEEIRIAMSRYSDRDADS